MTPSLKRLSRLERAAKYSDHEQVGRALGVLGAYMSHMLSRIYELERARAKKPGGKGRRK